MACLREPCPPVNGYEKEETDTSPHPGWSFQEMFCKTDGPFTLLPHCLSLSDSIKETGIQTQIRWFFRDTSLPSSRSAGLLNKAVFLASAPPLWFIGLSCGEQSELGLGNKGKKAYKEKAWRSKLKQSQKIPIIYFVWDLKKNPINFRTLNRNTVPGLKERIRGSPWYTFWPFPPLVGHRK